MKKDDLIFTGKLLIKMLFETRFLLVTPKGIEVITANDWIKLTKQDNVKQSCEDLLSQFTIDYDPLRNMYWFMVRLNNIFLDCTSMVTLTRKNKVEADLYLARTAEEARKAFQRMRDHGLVTFTDRWYNEILKSLNYFVAKKYSNGCVHSTPIPNFPDYYGLSASFKDPI